MTTTETLDDRIAGVQRAARLGLAAILLVYLLLAVLQSYATRLQWGPDEPAHIIYVRSLAEDRRLPSLTHTTSANAYLPDAARTHQAQHPPLYYALASLVWTVFQGRPDEAVVYTDRATAETHAFTVPGPVRPVRFLSLAFGLATLLCLWATARTVFPARPVVWLAGLAFTAFVPMFTYMSGVIGNDSLLALIFAATAWQWARIARFGAGSRDLVLLGLLIALGLNTKETALALLPVSYVLLALEPSPRRWPHRLAGVAAVTGIAFVLGGWWFLRKEILYGSPFVYPFHAPLLGVPEDQRSTLLRTLPSLIFLYTFIPAAPIFGYVQLAPFLVFFGLFSAVSTIGIVVLLINRRKLSLPRASALSILLWLGLSALVLAGLWWNLLTVDWRMGTSGGRLLLCVLPLLALAAAAGLHALFRQARTAAAVLTLTSVLLLSVNAYVIWATAASYGTL